jgi:hypothetical protein
MADTLSQILKAPAFEHSTSENSVRDIRVGGFEMHLYPDSVDLESDRVSISIRDKGSPDSCSGESSESYFTMEQKDDCTEITNHYETDMGPAERKTSYCKTDVLRTTQHTYKIGQVLERCERFNKFVVNGGGIKHPDLYQYPLIRLVDENGDVWVTESSLLDRYVQITRSGADSKRQIQQACADTSCLASLF